MNNKYVTPLRLWSAFTPDGDLNIRVVTDKEYDVSCVESYTEPVEQQSYRVTELYFSGVISTDGEVRVYAKYIYSEGKRPCVVVLRPAGEPICADEYAFYLAEGFNILCVDYAGQQEGRCTLFPDSLSFAQYSPEMKETLNQAPNGAEQSAWYIWAKIAMRGVTFLKQQPTCNGEVVIHGEREGGALGWILASIDSRVSRVAILFEAGYTPKDKEVTDAHSVYSATLSPQAYAQAVKCPLLLIMASNDNTAFERVFESIKRIPEGIPSYLSIAPRLKGQITVKNLATLRVFVRECVEGVSLLPIRPSITAQASQSKLYYNITTGAEDLRRIRLYYSACKDASYRNWEMEECVNAGEGEYIARAKVYNSADTVYAFANVEYTDSVVLSTQILARTPSEMGIASSVDETAMKLLYDSSMQAESFVCECGSLVNCGVSLEAGPFGIQGIAGKQGNLCTYKITMPQYRADVTASLMVSFNVTLPTTVFVTATEKTAQGIRVFKASKDVAGGAFWQKLTFARSDFKTAEGCLLPSWDNVVMLSFAKDVLFNNIAWV